MPTNPALAPTPCHPAVQAMFDRAATVGVSLYALEEKSGVSRAAFRRWKKGISPQLHLLEATLAVVGLELPQPVAKEGAA